MKNRINKVDIFDILKEALKGKIVNCQTQKESDQYLKIFGVSEVGNYNWDKYKEETCYCSHLPINNHTYVNINHHSSDKCSQVKIYKFEDLVSGYNNSVLEFCNENNTKCSSCKHTYTQKDRYYKKGDIFIDTTTSHKYKLILYSNMDNERSLYLLNTHQNAMCVNSYFNETISLEKIKHLWGSSLEPFSFERT